MITFAMLYFGGIHKLKKKGFVLKTCSAEESYDYPLLHESLM